MVHQSAGGEWEWFGAMSWRRFCYGVRRTFDVVACWRGQKNAGEGILAIRTLWTCVAVLLAFAQGAAAEEWGLWIFDTEQTYASELFGTGGADLTIDYKDSANTPTLYVTLVVTDAEIRTIEVGDTADVTITLANAKFARNVPIGNFSTAIDVTGGGPVQPGQEFTVIEKRDGGARGDSSVTVRIAAGGTNAGWAAATDASLDLIFRLPPLTGLNKKPVTPSVSVDSPTGSGLVSSNKAGVTAQAGFGVKITDGVITVVDDPDTDAVEGALVDFADALTFWSWGDLSSDITLGSGRMGLVWPEGWVASADSFQGHIARITVGVTDVAAGPLQLDGDVYSIDRREDGDGEVNATVTGDFRTGDTVYLDMNRNGAPDAGEALTLGSDGSMTGDFRLVDVAGNPNAPATDETAREEGVGSTWLRYRPNGTDALRPTQFRTVFALDYDLDTSDTETLPHVAYNTTYAGVESTQKAYAIPPIGSADVGNVRVKCEAATECTVYLECDDQAGDSWFANAGQVEVRATMVMQSAAWKPGPGSARSRAFFFLTLPFPNSAT